MGGREPHRTRLTAIYPRMMKRFCFALLLAAAACGPKPQPVWPNRRWWWLGDATGDDCFGDHRRSELSARGSGTSITVEDTTGGAALVFVTTGDAAAVRTRATAFARMHAARDGASSALGMMFDKTWTAKEIDIDGGAKVELDAAKPEDAGALQSELRMHAHHLTGGSCEM